MQLDYIQILVSSIFFFITAATSTSGQHNDARPIIVDTDIFSDVDDVGSLAVANVLHNWGLADLRGIVINTHSKYGALAASSICTYYGNGDVPIAAIRPLTNETFLDKYTYTLGEYASKLSHNYPRTLSSASLTPTPLELYRTLLSATTNETNMNIISIGFLTNLASLLRSEPDALSPLSGPDLIRSSVNELIIMGGRYPSGWEYNFGGVDPESTAYVLAHWPKDVAITFSGGELGSTIFSGQTLQTNAPLDSPILAAYQWYVGRCSTIRESWDPLTTLYGILGLEGFGKIGLKTMLEFGNKDGFNSITSGNGSNAWVRDERVGNQHWLRLAEGVTNSSVAWLLNMLYTTDPLQERCLGGMREQ